MKRILNRLKEYLSDTDNLLFILFVTVSIAAILGWFAYINSTIIPGDVYLQNKIEYLESIGKDTSNVTLLS